MSIDEQHYLRLWDTIQGATAETLRDTAQKYFLQDNFIKVIVGE
jgi:predicted Zn-dependent peptidase